MHHVQVSRVANGKRNQGEFCGSLIYLDVLTKEITVSQSTYALKINKVTVRPRAQPEDRETTAEVRSLRECNGAVQRLAKESRPDLAVQVSLSQQALSDPWVRHCRQANAMVRRARQHHELVWRFLPVPLENLRLVMRTDVRTRPCRTLKWSVTSWLRHRGDWWSLGKRGIGTLEPVDLAKSQNASNSGQHPGCRNVESLERAWARRMDRRTLC